jgi:hypothetical protein
MCGCVAFYSGGSYPQNVYTLAYTYREHSHFLTARAARYFAHNTPLRYESVNKAKRVEEAAAARINMMDAPLWFGGGRYACRGRMYVAVTHFISHSTLLFGNIYVCTHGKRVKELGACSPKKKLHQPRT